MKLWNGLLALAVMASCIGVLGAAEKKGTAAKSKEKAKPKRVLHVVAFKFKEEVTKEQIDKVCKEFAALKDKIPQIVRFQAGVNNSPEKLNKGLTHCFILMFKNAKARDEYLPHPAHQEFGKSLGPLIADVFVIDFETD